MSPSNQDLPRASKSRNSIPVDATTAAGQLAMRPYLTEEQARREAKRESNRRNAAKARVRNKTLLVELHEKCTELTKRSEELKRENAVLRAQLEIYKNKWEGKAEREPAPSASPPPLPTAAPAASQPSTGNDVLPLNLSRASRMELAQLLLGQLHTVGHNSATLPLFPQGTQLLPSPGSRDPASQGTYLSPQDLSLLEALRNQQQLTMTLASLGATASSPGPLLVDQTRQLPVQGIEVPAAPQMTGATPDTNLQALLANLSQDPQQSSAGTNFIQQK